MARGQRLTDADRDYIRTNCDSMTDQQLADKLGVSESAVIYNRRKLGVTKPGGRRQKQTSIENFDVARVTKSTPNFELKQLERKLEQSPRGVKIKRLLKSEDWAIFVEEWRAFHIQFENLTHTEQTTVEHIIYLRLRILQNQKEMYQVIISKEKMGNTDRSTLDLDDPHEHQLFIKLQSLDSHITDLNKEYRELLDKANKLFQSLSGTREQRERKGAVNRETFWSLVQEFRDSHTRHHKGRMAELLKIATQKNKDKLREGVEFADGEVAPQLLDSETVIEMEKQKKQKIEKEKDQC